MLGKVDGNLVDTEIFDFPTTTAFSIEGYRDNQGFCPQSEAVNAVTAQVDPTGLPIKNQRFSDGNELICTFHHVIHQFIDRLTYQERVYTSQQKPLANDPIRTYNEGLLLAWDVDFGCSSPLV